MERTRLFLHSNNEGVSRDATWLENNIIIEGVEYIRHKLTFQPKGNPKASRNVNRTAAVANTQDKSVGKSHTLYVTPKREFYDIALALVRLVLQKPKPHSALLFESLLSNGKRYPPGRAEVFTWVHTYVGCRLDDAQTPRLQRWPNPGEETSRGTIDGAGAIEASGSPAQGPGGTGETFPGRTREVTTAG